MFVYRRIEYDRDRRSMNITIMFETSWYLNGKEIKINRHLTKLLSAMKFDADYRIYKERENENSIRNNNKIFYYQQNEYRICIMHRM